MRFGRRDEHLFNKMEKIWTETFEINQGMKYQVSEDPKFLEDFKATLV